jgi:hypothetical protein
MKHGALETYSDTVTSGQGAYVPPEASWRRESRLACSDQFLPAMRQQLLQAAGRLEWLGHSKHTLQVRRRIVPVERAECTRLITGGALAGDAGTHVDNQFSRRIAMPD